ncbi:MAG: hypothetical protein V7K48_29085 [Nostoc sp.]|uniref:hypothetical protein n=1 Tax=Nostoc sp. TaxID=1180 RepID=UPI002FF5C11B
MKIVEYNTTSRIFTNYIGKNLNITSVAIAFSQNSWYIGIPVAPHVPNDQLF